MSYSKKEKYIAYVLNRFPFLKQKIKKAYVALNRLKSNTDIKSKCHHMLTPIQFNDEESFFGYYDHSPENKSGSILFHSSPSKTNTKPTGKEALHICIHNFKTNKTEKIATTHAYNWQQGSRLMWYDENKAIFNFYNTDKNALEAKIVDVESKSEWKRLTSPIYDCVNKKILTLNFERLNIIAPDYGYAIKKSNTKSLPSYDEDGIFELKEDGSKLLLFTINKAIELIGNEALNGTNHKFNHIMISPDAANYMVLFRFVYNGQRKHYLFISDFNNNIKLAPTTDVISHCCWQNNVTLIAWIQHTTFSGYASFSIGDSKWTYLKEIPITEDGHPSIQNNSLLFDTYPNRQGYEQLLEYNFQTKKTEKVGEFYHPLHYFGASRCDLHPRYGVYTHTIYFDSVYSSKRKLYKLSKNNKL